MTDVSQSNWIKIVSMIETRIGINSRKHQHKIIMWKYSRIWNLRWWDEVVASVTTNSVRESCQETSIFDRGKLTPTLCSCWNQIKSVLSESSPLSGWLKHDQATWSISRGSSWSKKCFKTFSSVRLSRSISALQFPRCMTYARCERLSISGKSDEISSTPAPASQRSFMNR